MALIPDEAVLDFFQLTAAEIRVFSFYCKVRNRKTGGWRCTDRFVSDRIKLSRSRVCEARNSLTEKGWVVCEENHFIRPIYGFDVVENQTIVESSDVEDSTLLVDAST